MSATTTEYIKKIDISDKISKKISYFSIIFLLGIITILLVYNFITNNLFRNILIALIIIIIIIAFLFLSGIIKIWINRKTVVKEYSPAKRS